MGKYLLSITLIFSALALIAQDTQFSQFYASPLTLNPALTGAFNGKYRVSTIYRDQWASALDNPYQTVSASADLRFNVGKYRSSSQDAAAVGILFLSDRVKDVDYSSNQINISGAYHKSLNGQNTTYLSLGTQIGMVQRSLNYNGLNFGDQFNGDEAYSNPTQESFPENNVAFSDLAVGVNFSYIGNNNVSVFAGGAMHHILQSDISFYQIKDEENPFPNRLLSRYSAQLNVRIPVNSKFQFMPRALVNLQGSNFRADAGVNFRFLLSQFNGTALQLGTYVRPVSDVDNPIGIDALIFMAGIEYSNVLFGFSYDMNLLDLSSMGTQRTAFEISIAYLGEYENETILCPKF